jgi:hypothetical protein
MFIVDLLKSYVKNNRNSFVMGSSLVDGIEHKDVDVVMFCSESEFRRIENEDYKPEDAVHEKSLGNGPIWRSVRVGVINIIATTDPEFFFRMKAFAGALSMLQLKDKDARKALCIACTQYKCNRGTQVLALLEKEESKK